MKYSLLSSIAATALIATSALGEEVRVYNWSDYIDEDLLQKFEKETGIDLIYDVFDSNEVLETKMLAVTGIFSRSSTKTSCRTSPTCGT